MRTRNVTQLAPRKPKKTSLEALKTRFRSVGVRHSIWMQLRDYCALQDMNQADFVEAMILYGIGNQVKIRTSVEIDHGTLPKGETK